MNIINIMIGLTAGILGGLLGVGGGIIMIPLMVGVLKMKQHQAHGTSLFALVFTGIAGSITYAFKGSIDVQASLLLASAAIITARAGARFASSLPEWKLKKSFGIFIILMTILLLAKPFLTFNSVAVSGWLKILILLLTGGVTGFISGLMGVGGGVIMVPAMVLLVGLTQYTAQGSSLLSMVPIGAVGAYTHWRLGNANTQILPGLILGILVGTFLGGSVANFLPEALLRVVFAILMIYTGIKYIRTPKPEAETQ